MAQAVKGQELKRKIVFSLDSPNSTVEWPNISSANQGIILDLLCSLIEPIGQYRNLYTQPSKGRRSRKRKRTPLSDTSFASTQALSIPPPPPPELTSFLTVGLNSTNRHLESMSQTPLVKTPLRARLLAVFVCRSDSQPSQLHSHFPLLCYIASQSSQEHPVKLVQLPKGAEMRLKTSLAIPQVGFLGLMEGAPGSSSLLRFLDERVPTTKVPWLEGSLRYQTTIIKTMKTTAPPSKRLPKKTPKKTPKGYLVKTVVCVGSSEDIFI